MNKKRVIRRTRKLGGVFQEASLFDSLLLSEKEKKIFLGIIKLLREKGETRLVEIVDSLGEPKSVVMNVITKMLDAKMLEKIKKSGRLVYYKLSPKFSQILRRWAEEWEEIVKKTKSS